MQTVYKVEKDLRVTAANWHEAGRIIYPAIDRLIGQEAVVAALRDEGVETIDALRFQA